MKESCKRCYYWTGKGGIGHAYKCYTSKCPAKQRDDKAKEEKLREKKTKKKRSKVEFSPNLETISLNAMQAHCGLWPDMNELVRNGSRYRKKGSFISR